MAFLSRTLKNSTYFKKLCPIVGNCPEKFSYWFFSFSNMENTWISMFFIKFSGNIEIILGFASNNFNITLEFNEKHLNPRVFHVGKWKKPVGKFFWTVTDSGNSYFLLVDVVLCFFWPVFVYNLSDFRHKIQIPFIQNYYFFLNFETRKICLIV